MTILADHQLRALCVAPETVLDQIAFQNEVDHTAFPLGRFAHAQLMQELRKKHTRPSTEAERAAFEPLIFPFVDGQVKTKVHRPDLSNYTGVIGAECDREVRLISYGLSSFGYDVRLQDEPREDGKPLFVIFSNHNSGIIDPKNANPERDTIPLPILVDENGCKYVLMPAHSYGMGYTKEFFQIPRNMNIICLGKSTYARSAVFVNVTPIEAGFKGNVVIELGNHSGSPVKIYLNEGIAQFQFEEGVDCEVSYGDRDGKYQGQEGLVHSRC